MSVRCIPIISQLARSHRQFHPAARRYFGMASGEGVPTKELEEALKTRLSAVHTEVADISGLIQPLNLWLMSRRVWPIV